MPSLVTRIRSVLHALSASERRLAEVVIDFPGDIAGYSASELARLANVSNATVTRFVRRLGYASYEQARLSARAEHGAGSPLFLAGSQKDRPLGSAAAHVEQSVANLAATFNRIDDALVDTIAGAMFAARKVWIVGFRATHGLAYYLRWQIYQVLEGATLIPGAGETLAESTASVTSEDVVVVFALRRRITALPVMVAERMRAGAEVLVITNTHPAVDYPCTWLIHCDTQAPGPLDNHAAVLGFAHVLATRVMEKAGPRGRTRMAGIQSVHDALDEL